VSDDQVIYRNTLDDMRDGVMVIDLQGTVRTINRSAEAILDLSADEVIGRRFGEVFLALEGSDDFVQAALDAVYESTVKHQHVVEFGVQPNCKTLAMTTSFLFGESDQGDRTKRIGVIAVFSDITELEELRDALKAMEEIQRLNGELEVRNEFIQSIFGRYVSKEVVARLIEEPEALELGGSKHEISLMMTDLRGFTALSERLDPDAVVAMLNHYLSVMTGAIARHQGSDDASGILSPRSV